MKKHAFRLLALALLLAMVLPLFAACQQPKTDVRIGENGNWFIDGIDTGVPATGLVGGNGADGTDGTDGQNGSKVTIGKNGKMSVADKPAAKAPAKPGSRPAPKPVQRVNKRKK